MLLNLHPLGGPNWGGGGIYTNKNEAPAVYTADFTASGERLETLAWEDLASFIKTTTANTIAFSTAEGGKHEQAKKSSSLSTGGGGPTQAEGSPIGKEFPGLG